MKLEVNKGKKQDTYYVRITVNKKRKKINLGHNYALALQKLRELEDNPNPNKIQTLADVWNHYVQYGFPSNKVDELALTTKRNYTIYWETQIQPKFGHCRLDEIYSSDIKEHVRERALVAKSAANRERAIISILFNYAINELEIQGINNPCFGVKRRKEVSRKKYVEKWEYEAIYQHASSLLKDVMDLCLYSGQRPGDVLDMTVNDFIKNVDLTGTLLHDGSLASEITGKQFGDFLKVTTNKTNQKIRILVEGPLETVIERIMDQRKTRVVSSLYLLHDNRGEPIKYRKIHAHWKRALLMAGFKMGDIQLRDLRAKNASDDTLENANKRLAHRHTDMTDRYRDKVRGVAVRPLLRLL